MCGPGPGPSHLVRGPLDRPVAAVRSRWVRPADPRTGRCRRYGRVKQIVVAASAASGLIREITGHWTRPNNTTLTADRGEMLLTVRLNWWSARRPPAAPRKIGTSPPSHRLPISSSPTASENNEEKWDGNATSMNNYVNEGLPLCIPGWRRRAGRVNWFVTWPA